MVRQPYKCKLNSFEKMIEEERQEAYNKYWKLYWKIFTICSSLFLLLAPYSLAAEQQLCMECIKESRNYNLTQQFIFGMIIAKSSPCLASSVDDIKRLRIKVKK